MDEGKCTSMLIVIFTLYLAFTVVVPHPSTTDDWVISINKFALFNILKDTNPQNDPITREVAQSVLSRILAEKDISMEDVNTSKASESMLSNLRRLASQFKKASSQRVDQSRKLYSGNGKSHLLGSNWEGQNGN